MLVPASFGLVGLVFAFVSLIPWSVFCVVVAVRLLRLPDSRRPTSPQQQTSGLPWRLGASAMGGRTAPARFQASR